MQIYLDGDNYAWGFSETNTSIENAVNVTSEQIEAIDMTFLHCYYYDKAMLVFVLDEQKKENHIAFLANQEVENQKESLRQAREKECFVYVNRGALWYATLSEEQIAEFNQWYQDWLNVTNTLVAPPKPIWLE